MNDRAKKPITDPRNTITTTHRDDDDLSSALVGICSHCQKVHLSILSEEIMSTIGPPRRVCLHTTAAMQHGLDVDRAEKFAQAILDAVKTVRARQVEALEVAKGATAP